MFCFLIKSEVHCIEVPSIVPGLFPLTLSPLLSTNLTIPTNTTQTTIPTNNTPTTTNPTTPTTKVCFAAS